VLCADLRGLRPGGSGLCGVRSGLPGVRCGGSGLCSVRSGRDLRLCDLRAAFAAAPLLLQSRSLCSGLCGLRSGGSGLCGVRSGLPGLRCCGPGLRSLRSGRDLWLRHLPEDLLLQALLPSVA
jgi:hypothetical protein